MLRRPDIRFIVLSPGRAGSTMLMARLGTHPEIATQGELLREGYRLKLSRWQKAFSRLRPGHFRFDGEDVPGFLDRVLWRPAFRPRRAAGFKLLEQQYLALSPAGQQALRSVPGLKVLYLDRDDMLAHRVSLKRVSLHGYVFRREGQPTVDLPSVPLTPEEFISFVRNRRVQKTYFHKVFSDLPLLDVSYERLVAEPEAENARMLDFLGLPRLPLRDTLLQNSFVPLEARIADYERFARDLEGTPYARYLPGASPAPVGEP